MNKKPTKQSSRRQSGKAEGKGDRSRAVATARSTSGSGFDFEDRVAARLLLNILSGQQLPGVDGTGTRLQTQTEALGWFVDDLLATTTVAPNVQRRLAVSCKSNVQVSAQGLPRDFVERAWKQWFAPEPMKRGRDRLALATRGRHPQFHAIWAAIKTEAASPDAALALARVRKPAKHSRVFESVKRPAVELGFDVTDSDVLALIEVIDVLPWDFHLSGSADETTAVAQCRTLLVNGKSVEGKRLWDELIDRARNARIGHGTIEIADLWRDLRRLFELKGLPDFLPSWERLEALSRDYCARIETTLPSGCALERKEAADELTKLIAGRQSSIVYGDSGTGKSALVKAVLDTRFPSERPIWFGPDDIAGALSELDRTQLGITHPLISVLDASPHASNVLVIDAAERLSRELLPKVKSLVADLLARKGTDGKSAWRSVIIGQTEAWVSGQLQDLSSAELPAALELKPLSIDDVRLALRSTDKLYWLAGHDDAVSALTNLRALGWVIEAAPRFEGQDSAAVASLTAIADRLWDYWTDRNPEVERLLMRLGKREASFEHSFPLSDFEGADASALSAMPKQCPLRRNPRNQYEFQHDLASDWARFQWLKQFAHDRARWAALASNPLWNGALRMLGQFLLREREGSRSAWDAAFEEAEQSKDQMPLAADILLDALCLDPEAEKFLNERVEMLFANNGRRLLRLLRRFEHIGSVPGVNPELVRSNPSLSLYLEAQLRTPIFGRWPPVARFLTKHRLRAAALISPVIAALCERWLTSTPVKIGDTPIPFRKEFAELAYATARELQFQQAKHTMFVGDSEKPIYRAAFLGAPELPDEVSRWALEMGQRRPLQPDMVARLAEYRSHEAEKHKERLKTDIEYRKRIERKRSIPTFIPSGTKLPPWPLGPQGRIDNLFADTVRHSGALHQLMRVRPADAAELLLASIIEDSPEESYGRRTTWDDGLGIDYDTASYPTAYWDSPFSAFLRINTEVALEALHQLIEFVAERWDSEARRGDGSSPPKLPLRLADGTERAFAGGFRVFNWSQTNSHHIGQLTSALAALEQWLCDLIDRGGDITPHIEALLRRSSSVAVLGVLVNVGKYKRELLKGPLKPLLAVHRIYLWDYGRAGQSGTASFDGLSWLRQGNALFELARAWVLAPHRQTTLRQIAPELLQRDLELAEFILASTATWHRPEGEKQLIEFNILVAELDYHNYRTVEDEAGQERVQFEYPPDVKEAVQAFEQQHAIARQTLALPDFARRALGSAGTLTVQQAMAVDTALSSIDDTDNDDLDDDIKESARIAGAVTLLVKAPDWLLQNQEAGQRARAILKAAMATIKDDSESHRRYYSLKQSTLEFAAYAVALDWIANPSKNADEAVLRILTSGDERAVVVLIDLAFQHRASLGLTWWRFLQMALLWSGLSILAPRYDDDESLSPRWVRWLAWLRRRHLSGTSTCSAAIDPLNIAKRVEQFERKRWQQRYAGKNWQPDFQPGRRFSGGLNTHFLQKVFFWLFDPNAVPVGDAEKAEWTALVLRFWTYEAWCRTGSADDDDDYKPLSQMLGYELVSALARLTLLTPVSQAEQVWRPVLELGPRGHYSVGSFLDRWFDLITATTDVEAFAARWRSMIEYVLAAAWTTGRYWSYGHQLERKILGFGADSFIIRTPGHDSLVSSMRDLYKSWAEKRLPSDEDNLAGLCGFLSTEAGKALRLDGLIWIAGAIKADASAGKWYRDRTNNAFIEFLDAVVTEHAQEISKRPETRNALIELVAHAVARQIPAALALQERVRRGF